MEVSSAQTQIYFSRVMIDFHVTDINDPEAATAFTKVVKGKSLKAHCRTLAFVCFVHYRIATLKGPEEYFKALVDLRTICSTKMCVLSRLLLYTLTFQRTLSSQLFNGSVARWIITTFSLVFYFYTLPSLRSFTSLLYW